MLPMYRQKWQRVYLNLKRIKLNEKSVENENGGTLSDKLSGVIVPKNCGRKLELYNIHQIGKVAVRQQEGNDRRCRFTVRQFCISYCKGPYETDVSNVVLSSLSLKQKDELAIEFVEKSTFCDGISLPDVENFQALVAHMKGNYRDRTDDKLPHNQTVVYFSTSCKIFSSTGGSCSE